MRISIKEIKRRLRVCYQRAVVLGALVVVLASSPAPAQTSSTLKKPRQPSTTGKPTSKKSQTKGAAAVPGALNFITKFDGAGNPTLSSVMFDDGAKVGIGTTNPFRMLTIGPSQEAACTLEPADASPNAGYIRFGDHTGWKLHFGRSRESSLLNGGTLDTGTIGVLMTIQDNGNVGIGTIAPDAKLHVFGPVRVHAAPPDDNTQDNAEFVLTNRGKGGAPYTWRLQTAAVAGGFGVQPNALEIWEYPQDSFPGCCLPRLRIMPVSGNQGTAPTPVTILANGTLQTNVLQILGGSDVAEPFEISEADAIRPGFAVIIDPDRPGHLRVADKAYDRRVAGVVSGANGMNPGLTMRQQGTVADGAHPVALTGRVYCWADASYGPIEPGDLLTTSNTPGHAMKATDDARAQGAILGKAMSGLKQGRGLVLVLVTLQ